MKYVLIVLALAMMGNAQADSHEKKGDKAANFEEHKAKFLENLNQRISALEEAKGCASSAKDNDGLGACRKKLMEGMKNLRSEMKRERMSNIDEKIKNLQKKKEEMGKEKDAKE